MRASVKTEPWPQPLGGHCEHGLLFPSQPTRLVGGPPDQRLQETFGFFWAISKITEVVGHMGLALSLDPGRVHTVSLGCSSLVFCENKCSWRPSLLCHR